MGTLIMSNDKPLISVIIPVYNGERFLRNALDSIFAQDYKPFEVIVIDDGSTDRSSGIARSYKDVHYIRQENRGVTVARNAGIRAARGEFVAFLDQDDMWAQAKLSRQVGYLLDHADVGYVLARQKIFLEPGTVKPSWLKEELLEGDQAGYLPGTLVVRRRVFDRIGLFNASFRIGSDTDWLARAKDAGVPTAMLEDVLLLRRVHCNNLSSQTRPLHSDMTRLLKDSIDRQRMIRGREDGRK